MIRTYRRSATQSLRQGKRCPRGAFVNAEPLEEYVREQLRTLLSGLDVEIGEETSEDLRTLEQLVLDAESELAAFLGEAETHMGIAPNVELNTLVATKLLHWYGEAMRVR